MEGSVKMANNRLDNRWQLAPENFRMEQTIVDVMKHKSFKKRNVILNKAVAIEMKSANAIKEMVYLTNKVNAKHYPSVAVDRMRRDLELQLNDSVKNEDLKNISAKPSFMMD